MLVKIIFFFRIIEVGELGLVVFYMEIFEGKSVFIYNKYMLEKLLLLILIGIMDCKNFLNKL